MDKVHKEGWLGFIELCLKAKDQKKISSLLDLFLSPEEKTDLAKRYLIVKELLEDKKTQRQISKDLGVSIAKITRGSNVLKTVERKLLADLKAKLNG